MEKFDLTKILRVGDKVYSTILGHGTVESTRFDSDYPVRVKFESDSYFNFTKHGLAYNDEYGECVLFPSKGMRNWSKYSPVVQRYDFKPYDRILYWSHLNGQWIAGLFSHYANNTDNDVVAVGGDYYCSCIPYEGNEHLLGTNKSE